jgi:outer membrane protein assembly factor BamA
MKGFAYIILIAVLAASCSKKLIPENDTLYTGSTVKIENANGLSSKQQKAVKSELQGMIRPIPNAKVLGMRIKLWMYKLPLIGKRLGEPPVLTSTVNFQKNSDILQNRLENRGFFKARVTWDSTTKNRKTSGLFTARLENRYTVRSISFPTDSSQLSRNITATAKESLLKTGVPYDLDVIKAERARIDAALKNIGYYYFSADYIIINVDSTIGDNKVDLFLRVKPLTPDESRNIYRINEVTVHADYSLDNVNLADTVKPDSIHNGYRIIDPAYRFKPKIFERTLVIKPGDIYKRDDHNLSLNRLVNLGVYKFVKVQFEDVPSDTAHLLNAYYYLTPLQRKSIRGEIGGLSRSSNTTGAEFQVSWRHRNLFKGAEQAVVSAFVGVERQISGQQPAANTNRFGFDINLVFPRITFPFRFNTSSEFVPQTRFNLGYEFFNRTTQYTLHSFKANSGYAWKEHITKEHQLNVLAINYVYPRRINENFQAAIDTNLFLARSIQKQLIFGSNYNFNLNNQLGRQIDLSRFYLNVNLDASGNVLGLIMGASENDPKSILSIPFSQYIRGEVEVRKSFPFKNSRTNMLATRIIMGGGYAYGNSIALPFIKSFFIGGANSIRAFRARSLGPGTFYGGNADTARRYLPDQPGDVKLELNAELRFNIASIFNGALFVDAGNIWTLRKDPARPGAEFTGKFLNQLAVGVGAGLRVDLTLVVLRGDLAFPIRKPFEEGTKIDFTNSDWRRQNLIFNLAIGYPF